MSFLSYAQNFEDVLLWRALSHVQKGFYVDIGAQDPLIDSVSLAFYERGWHGVNVEPVPQYAQMLREQRPRDILIAGAVSDVPDVLRLFEIPGTGISTASKAIADSHRARGYEAREIVVPCVTLATVFELIDSPEVHWLKIDVEGHEQQVLSGWGTASTRPWIVVVESTLPLSQVESYAAWEPLLLARDYKFAYFDGLNRYYVSGAHLELCDALRSPPNIFDDFELNGTASAPFHRHLVTHAQAELDRIEKARIDQSAQAQRELGNVTKQLEELGKKHQATLDQHHAERTQWYSEQHNLTTRASNALEQLRLMSDDAIRKERELNQQLLTLQERVAQNSAEAKRDYMECVEQLTARMERQASIALEQSTAYAVALADLRRDRELMTQDFALERTRQQDIFDGRLSEYRHRVFGLQKVIAEITNSFSWRITGPIRVFSSKSYAPVDDTYDGDKFNFDDSTLEQKELKPADNLRQLMGMSDVEFVKSAYLTILGRLPDAGGAEHYAIRLQSGESRTAILRDLYRSDEARRAKVRIPWLGRAVFRYRALCMLIPGFRNRRSWRVHAPVEGVIQRIDRLEQRIQALTHGAMETPNQSAGPPLRRSETVVAERNQAATHQPPDLGLSDREAVVARRIFRELVESAKSPPGNI